MLCFPSFAAQGLNKTLTAAEPEMPVYSGLNPRWVVLLGPPGLLMDSSKAGYAFAPNLKEPNEIKIKYVMYGQFQHTYLRC